MGKAKEQEVRLMGLGFVALAVLAALVLVAGAMKLETAVRSHGSGAPAAGIELVGVQQR